MDEKELVWITPCRDKGKAASAYTQNACACTFYKTVEQDMKAFFIFISNIIRWKLILCLVGLFFNLTVIISSRKKNVLFYFLTWKGKLVNLFAKLLIGNMPMFPSIWQVQPGAAQSFQHVHVHSWWWSFFLLWFVCSRNVISSGAANCLAGIKVSSLPSAAELLAYSPHLC